MICLFVINHSVLDCHEKIDEELSKFKAASSNTKGSGKQQVGTLPLPIKRTSRAVNFYGVSKDDSSKTTSAKSTITKSNKRPPMTEVSMALVSS